MAVQIYSDNSDEVTGATLNGGDTGGPWTKAGELLTGRPDGGLAVFVAEVPTPARSRAAASTGTRPRR